MRNKAALILSCAFLAGCTGTPETPEAETRPEPSAITPTAGPAETLLMEWTEQFSNVEQADARVCRTPEEWKSLWKRIGAPEAPAADMNAYFAVAVFLGQRNTGGHSVRLLDPEVKNDKQIIRWEERKPTGIVFQAITYPYAVRLYPKTTLPIVVEAAPAK